MKTVFKRISTVAVAASAMLVGCKDVLDLTPTNEITAERVYSTGLGYYQSMAKVYGSFALTGQRGPASDPGQVNGADVSGNEGFSDFLRTSWELQELPTDEAVIAWGDVGLPDFHRMTWTSSNPFLNQLYARCSFHIVLANEFIREAGDGNLSRRGISADTVTTIRQFREEARFVRAYQHWIMMDLWGDIPIITEANEVGASLPVQRRRAEVFTFLETELKDLETKLPDAGSVPNTRATKAAAQALLARLYLNAGIYTGTERYADAAVYAQKVINGGFTLCHNYRFLFLADNNEAPASNEHIFTVALDGIRTQSYGATNFLTHAATGGRLTPAFIGVESGWAGLRTTKNLVFLFDSSAFNLGRDTTIDKRAMFFTRNQSLEISNITSFTNGYAIYKWRNKKKDFVTNGSAPNRAYVDIDYPLFRLAEMHLIYAEAAARGAADAGQGLLYVNTLRRRAAHGSGLDSTQMDIVPGDLTPDFILNERARELYWEGHRRTDLIRYNRFTKNYNWPFKGNVPVGADVDNKYALYPFPSDEVIANPNLRQNPGY